MPAAGIAVVHYTCSPVIGGVEIVIESHAGLLADRGFSTVVVAGRGEWFDRRVPVEILPGIAAARGSDLSFGETKETILAGLREVLSGVDICIVHNAFTMHFNLPLTAALGELAGEGAARFVAWTHDIAAINPWYADTIGEDYPWKMMREPVPAAAYVTNSNMRRRELCALFDTEPEAVRVIPNGIDSERFVRKSGEVLSDSGSALLQRLDLARDDIVMLYPARIVRRKNIELALGITRAVNARGKKTRLLVTGAPDPHNADSRDYYDSLRELAEELRLGDRVVFLGELEGIAGQSGGVDAALVPDLYEMSDLLLFPTRREGFGIPILEAGAARLPVACSRIEPLTEIAGEDVLYLDPEGAPETMARDIIDYLDSCDTEPLFERVMKSYTWPVVFRKYIEPLLESLVAGVP